MRDEYLVSLFQIYSETAFESMTVRLIRQGRYDDAARVSEIRLELAKICHADA